MPLHFSNEVSLAPIYSLVDELGLLTESHGVSPDQVSVSILERVVFFVVQLEPNLICSFVKENHLVHLVKLVVDFSLGLLVSWLKIQKEIHHEVAVDLVIPAIIAVLMRTEHILELEDSLI